MTNESLSKKTVCPLLADPLAYNPDTLNLNEDDDARIYWFKCFENIVEGFARRAEQSQIEDPTAKERALSFRNEYIECLRALRVGLQTPGIPVTVRTLLDLNESCLRSHGFNDTWLAQKVLENNSALGLLGSRLEEIDALPFEEKWVELCKGLLAGNMFDWGAKAISEILEKDNRFGLSEALQYIQPRPWLIDDLDQWILRLKGPPHKCAAIFVDNSGVDIILGVLPFARELLLRKTNVILCANSEPALNDITHKELGYVVQDAAKVCDVFRNAIKDGMVQIMENGQNGPCLDLRFLHEDLCAAMTQNKVDLIIIEGMGRALHTNLYATFTCDSLKLAVVKNQWWATRLGGDMFSVICQFIPSSES